MSAAGLVDSHVHLTDYEPGTDVGEIIRQAEAAGVGRLVCNGTSEEDWPKVRELSEQFPSVIPCFGLHPWFVTRRSENWLAALESYLQAVPSGVGEIGLDKLADPLDESAQEQAFRAQLGLAVKYNRPATIHCVKAWGKLMDVLNSEPELPQRMMIHAYGGSVDLIKPLAAKGAYFSFSGKVLDEKYERARAALKAVPLDRLLLETDAPNMLPPEQFRTKIVTCSDGREFNYPANLPLILQGVADLLGMSADALREQAFINAQCLMLNAR